MTHRRSIHAAVLVVALITSASAQKPVPNTKEDFAKINLADLDLSVPESPAFTALGVTPTTVTRPSSPRSLATSLLNGVDQSGKFQTGFALDFAPYMLYQGNKLTLQEYQEGRYSWKRFLARTTISVGSAKGTTDSDNSSRLATGLRITIFDRGDPRMDTEYTKELYKDLESALGSVPPLPPLLANDQTEVAKHEKALQDAAKKATDPIDPQAKRILSDAKQKARKSGWNRSSMIVGLAPSWISKDGNAQNLGYNGATVWSSLGLRTTSHAQTILYARYQSRENVPDPTATGQFLIQDSDFAGGQFRAGTENTTGSFEAVYLHTHPHGRTSDDFVRLSLGAERKLAENLWLKVGIGSNSGQQNGQNKLFILSSFKWAFSGGK